MIHLKKTTMNRMKTMMNRLEMTMIRMKMVATMADGGDAAHERMTRSESFLEEGSHGM